MENKVLILDYNQADFKEKVLDTNNKLVIVDFWAPWCGPCHVMAPIFKEIAAHYQNNSSVIFGKVNVDENFDLSEEYQVYSIPTTKFFLNGEIVDEITGAVPGEVLTSKIDQALASIKS